MLRKGAVADFAAQNNDSLILITNHNYSLNLDIECTCFSHVRASFFQQNNRIQKIPIEANIHFRVN